MKPVGDIVFGACETSTMSAVRFASGGKSKNNCSLHLPRRLDYEPTQAGTGERRWRQRCGDRAGDAEQGSGKPVSGEGALSLARQADCKLLGKACDADGGKGPRPGGDPGGRRRGRRGLRARGLALPLRAWRAVERERQAAARK